MCGNQCFNVTAGGQTRKNHIRLNGLLNWAGLCPKALGMRMGFVKVAIPHTDIGKRFGQMRRHPPTHCPQSQKRNADHDLIHLLMLDAMVALIRISSVDA
jgi:hypothetical protein